MRKILIILFVSMSTFAQKPANILEQLLLSNPDKFKKLTDNPEKYRLQILYTQIDRDAKNKPRLTTYSYRSDSNEYFYPASTVKLAASVLALEKLNTLKIDKSTAFQTLKNRPSQLEIKTDTTAKSGLPSVEHYIKKILLVSDNEAYNRLYEFLGQRPFNEKMRSKGFNGVRLTHRLQTPLPRLENQYTNPINLMDASGKVIYQQAEAFNDKPYSAATPILLGKGTMNDAGVVEDKPLDFSLKNAYPLQAQHDFLKRLMLPDAFPAKDRFQLSKEDYGFLYRYMSMYPMESKDPIYKEEFATYCKFLYYGSEKNASLNPSMRIFNKVGDAYGFLLDNAYVVDFDKKVEFMVTAVLLCNEDEIFNDEKYDYDTIGFPFYKNLGQVIYDYEVKRPKKHLPNLDHLQFDYSN
ncbi:serine hydrolase [Aquirufa lenticrescens]|uniref:serine hydrolase n=1 Tax=Aquirufa lenticrescens TaxID=2696560 RepID=UPI001CAA7EB8|nr:serine hydrolase [Aquirufa lenticrescens]UAJ14604.1 serine hydrolase [Aquirufa lenticrescens]